VSVVPAGFREEPCSLNLSLLELLADSHRIQQCSQAWYRNMFRHTVLLSQSKNMDVLTPLQSIKYTMTHSFFSRAAQGDRVGCCFLRDVDVCGARIAELQESILLRPMQLGLDMTVQEIVAGLQSVAPCISGKLNVQSIGVQGFIA
jgi:hypothetical protein